MMSDEYCPLCSSKIILVQLNFKEALKMCPNKKCLHPITNLPAPLEFVKRETSAIVNKLIKDEIESNIKDESESNEFREEDILKDILNNTDSNAEIMAEEIADIDEFLLEIQSKSKESGSQASELQDFFDSLEKNLSLEDLGLK